MKHHYFMQYALTLAEKGKYKTAPNPCVGAVLVHKDTIIAEGYHQEYGQTHAEVNCLLQAIEKGIFYWEYQERKCTFSNKILQEAMLQNVSLQYKEKINITDCRLYVTLEPCNHTGKTPPCSHAVYESGIKHIIIGMLDPNPKAQGGLEYLKEKDIKVEVGILEQECQELLADFLIWQKQKRPYCILKMAMTLDGKIGLQKGHSYIITGQESKSITMQYRYNMALAHGAVMVGANTFYYDNPQLTVRGENQNLQPRAFIISNVLPENFSDFYLTTKRPYETVFFTSDTDIRKQQTLKSLGSHIEVVEKEKCGKINLKKVFESAFQNYNCPYIYCEGGASLAQSLLHENLVDLLIIYISPKIIGDEKAQSVFKGNSIHSMQEAYQFIPFKTELVGEDIHIYLKPKNKYNNYNISY